MIPGDSCEIAHSDQESVQKSDPVDAKSTKQMSG